MWMAIDPQAVAVKAAVPANDNDQALPRGNRTRFPAGTVARIFRRSPSPLSSGTGDTKAWRLVFRGNGRRFRDSLMGWTGSTDPLAALELKFPTLESAVRYAQRQALDFVIEGAPVSSPPADNPAGSAVVLEQAAKPWRPAA